MCSNSGNAVIVLFSIFIFSVTVFMAFGIYFLYLDFDVCDESGADSPLWLFSLMSLFSNIFQYYWAHEIYKHSIHQSPKACDGFLLFSLFLFITGMTIVITQGRLCEAEKHTGLYTWTLVSMTQQALMFLIGTFIALKETESVQVDFTDRNKNANSVLLPSGL